LSDRVARAPEYGPNSFYFGAQDIAVKTGTTNDYRDVWIIGYTPKLVVATWAGNNDNRPIVKKIAGFVIAPLWRAFMDEALKTYRGGEFVDPEPVNTNKRILQGVWYYPDINPPVHSILYWIDKNNMAGAPPVVPARDPLYAHMEYAVQSWFNKNAAGLHLSPQVEKEDNIQQNTQVQTVSDNTSKPLPQKVFKIAYPKQGQTLTPARPVSVQVYSKGITLKKVKYYLNQSYLGAVTSPPYSITIVPQKSDNAQIIKAVGIGSSNEEYFSQTSFIAK